MESFVQLILDSGKSTVNLALYILLPVMVVMLALMKWLEGKGWLGSVARHVSPLLRPFGLPGAGVFAALQVLLVSFAAPIATLAIMERDQTHRRHLAATVAMILPMSQANAVFPLIAVGLDGVFTWLSSVIGGLLAAALTYHWLMRDEGEPAHLTHSALPQDVHSRTTVSLLMQGGQEGLAIVKNSVPMLMLGILLVNALKAVGAIALLEALLSPLLSLIEIPSISVLPIATKFIAGGTAMMGVTLNLVQEGALTVAEMNRIAGVMIHPLDLLGVALYASVGPRVQSVIKPALIGGLVGVGTRSLLHWWWF
jgi:spore maturation protein SpmB